jgi:hypothetical protein
MQLYWTEGVLVTQGRWIKSGWPLINQPSSRIGMRPDRTIANERTGFKIRQVKLARPRIDQRSGSIPAKPVRHSNLDRQLFDPRPASFLPRPAQATAAHPRAMVEVRWRAHDSPPKRPQH